MLFAAKSFKTDANHMKQTPWGHECNQMQGKSHGSYKQTIITIKLPQFLNTDWCTI